MSSDKTRSGLIIQPSINMIRFIDGSRLRKDNFFAHHSDIAFNFFDPNESLVHDEISNGLAYKVHPTDALLSMEGIDNSDSEPGVINVQLGNYFSGGSKPPSGVGGTKVRHRVGGQCNIDVDQMDIVFTALAKRASENIANGTVSKEHLVDMIQRDAGIYEGTAHTKYRAPNSLGKGIDTKKLHNQQYETKTVDQLEQMHTNPELTFSSVQHELFRNDSKEPILKEVQGTALMSAVIHGIGPDKFLHTFLDEFKKLGRRENSAVNGLLGDFDNIGDKLTTRLIRALPVTSPYHSQVVTNYYKRNC